MTFERYRFRLLTSAAVLMLGISSTSAYGEPLQIGDHRSNSQDELPSDPKIDHGGNDIVVTATRQEVRASRVPISISAHGQAKLDQQGIKTFTDLQRQLPGVTINEDTRSVAVRGISSTAGAPTTGVYIDDTPFQLLNVGILAQNALPTVFDLDRIEVLRGPQGTLFGAGAQGGVVRYITPQPSLSSTKIYARSEIGAITNGDFDAETGVALNVPVIQDKVAVRLSAFARRDGGWIDQLDWRTYQTDAEDANSRKTVSLRGAVRFALGALEITPSLQYQYTKERENLFNIAASDIGGGDFRATDATVVPNRDSWYLPTIKAELNLGAVSVHSNTSWFRRHQRTGYSGTDYLARLYDSVGLPTLNNFGSLGTPRGIRLPIGDYFSVANIENSQNNFVQEVRVHSAAESRLNWVVGGFYSNNRFTNYEEIVDPMGDRLIQALYGFSYEDYYGSSLVGDLNYFGTNRVEDTQLAIFGEATWEFVDRLKLTLGARYAKVKLKFQNDQGGPLNGGPTGSTGRQSENPFTPRASLAFQIDPNNMVYATASKGFRIGGANAPIPAAPCAGDLAQLGLTQAPASYNGDVTWNYEIGSKNKFGGVSVSTSVYYVKWTGIQQSTILPTCGFRYIDNLGEARSKGFDLQLQTTVLNDFDINVAAAYTDARLTKAIAPPSGSALIVSRGQSLAAPEWTLAVGGQYNFEALGNKSFARIDYQHIDTFAGLTAQLDLATTSYDSALTKPPARDYVTARIGTTIGRFNLSFYIDNLLNSNELLTRTRPSQGWPVFSGTSWRPRAFILQAVFRQ